jgi:hypothetical protein
MGKDWYPECYLDQKWRLNHLYYIRSKEYGIMRFKMNWAQEYLFDNLHTRNNILKARQLGMSTFTSIYILDSCLHQSDYEAGIVDKTDEDAKEKLRKIKVAYEFMLSAPKNVGYDHVQDPEDKRMIAVWAKKLAERANATITKESAEFGNGSLIVTGTSLRGGTYQFLHLSEFGYVAAHLPRKAEEILSGAVETVPKNGIVVMESTHEGAKSGLNYEIIKSAMENESKPRLDMLDYRFFFFPWWKQKEYRIESEHPLHPRLDGYFDSLQQQGIKLDALQRRWYLAKERVLGDRMKTEYPSTPEEAFASRIDGAIYGSIISKLRAEGKTNFMFETDDLMPLYVSWDLGTADNTSMWLIQPGNDGRFYILDYYSNSDKAIPYYLSKVQEWEREHGQLVSMHYLPHDAAQRGRWDATSIIQHFANAHLPAIAVPKTNDVWNGIYATRMLLKHCIFHARVNRKPKVDEGDNVPLSGMECLEFYRTAGKGANGVIKEQPLHSEESHGADAFRIFAEAVNAGLVGKQGARRVQREEKFVPMLKQKAGLSLGVPNGW